MFYTNKLNYFHVILLNYTYKINNEDEKCEKSCNLNSEKL